jgi:3-oxoacyl-[acyl-carrier protein] reductase
MSENELARKRPVALVTGAASGIGYASSLLLAARGYAVTMVDLRTCDEDRLSEEWPQAAERLTLCVDVSNREQVDAAVDETVTRFGRLDVLATSAGHIELVSLEDLSEPVLDRMLAVHLKGTIHCVLSASRAMRPNGYGRIVCVSSAAAMKGSFMHSHYAAAKAGIVGFSKSSARELGPHGITINCILPGPIDTPLLGALSEDARRQLAENPVGRLGTAEEVAHAVCFLASPEAGFITGATLLMTGGDYV